MKLQTTEITDKIYLVTFGTQRDLTSTFLRFQEHYESPKFIGKVFSLEEFKEWYINNSQKGQKTGAFTYYSDWNGFNIPSYVLQPFHSGKFDPLSVKEKSLLRRFKDKPEPFYIIGVHRETKKLRLILQHEIAHGLFYTCPEYNASVLRIMSKFDVEPIKTELRTKAGYHEAVLEDECHAYSMYSGRKLKTQIPKELRKKLRAVYQEHLRRNNITFAE